jgi:hypothetical protein
MSKKAAFAPVGVMADFWADTLPPGEDREIPVILTNDLGQTQQGRVRLRLLRGGKTVHSATMAATVEPWGQATLRFKVAMPNEPGEYRLEASLGGGFPEKIRSLRDFKIVATVTAK